jgi:hypothetical protein
MWGFLLFLLIFSSATDFAIKKPKMGLFPFFFFYTLDQIAYQTGVFWGCVKNKTFMPYVPVFSKKV